MFFTQVVTIQSKVKLEFIEKTKSLCPICLKVIDTEVIKQEETVFLRKKCKEHGEFKIKHVWEDIQVYNLIKGLKSKKGKSANGLVINVNTNCNQNCPYCYMNANDVPDISISFDKIDKLLETFKGSLVYLSGGEPTIVPDICEKIRYIKQKGFDVVLFSNGKKLVNKQFVTKLKISGLDLVILQFDTLNDEVCKELRGEKLVKTKMKALRNLSSCKIPVYLFSMIVKDKNFDEIKDLIKFISTNSDYIKIINLQPVWDVGRVGEHEESSTVDILNKLVKDTTLSIDDFIKSTRTSHLISNLNAKLNNKNVNVHSNCEIRSYVFFRNGKLIPLSKLIDLDKIIDYISMLNRENSKSRMYLKLILGFPYMSLMKSIFTNHDSLTLLFEFIKNLNPLNKKPKFMILPITSINVGIFPNAKNIDFNLIHACNLYSDFPNNNNMFSACVRQIFINNNQYFSKNIKSQILNPKDQKN